MSFASYSEDILKRHESDVHDLMRELELGHISSAQQAHALPQFEALVRNLEKILLDPASPAAIRLIELRQQERRLAGENELLKTKNQKLATKNTELNARALRTATEKDAVRTELETSRRKRQVLERRISALEGEVGGRDKEIDCWKAKVKALEKLAMEAQVDRRV